MDKNELRKRYKQLRDTADRTDLDGKVFARLCGLDVWQNAAAVFSYVSFGSEVDTMRIIQHALEMGKKTAVPRMMGKRQMEFVEISSTSALVPNKYGILEPVGGEVATPKPGDVILVPGLVFSDTMCRIGYGGGFYDVYLSNAQGVKIGLCYDFQIMNGISAEGHDVPADYVVTDKRVLPIHPRFIGDGF